MYNGNELKRVAATPAKTRDELLTEAFELLLKLSPEQLAEIMEDVQ